MAHASSPTCMLNRGRGQQSWLDQGTQRRHAVPSLPTWIGIPGSFPNGSSPHEMNHKPQLEQRGCGHPRPQMQR